MLLPNVIGLLSFVSIFATAPLCQHSSLLAKQFGFCLLLSFKMIKEPQTHGRLWLSYYVFLLTRLPGPGSRTPPLSSPFCPPAALMRVDGQCWYQTGRLYKTCMLEAGPGVCANCLCLSLFFKSLSWTTQIDVQGVLLAALLMPGEVSVTTCVQCVIVMRIHLLLFCPCVSGQRRCGRS